MNKCLAILLTTVTLLVSLNDIAIYVSFKANQSFIAEYLCINKSQPDLCCKGKCYLTKKIKDSKNKEAEYPLAKLYKKVPFQLIIQKISLLYFTPINFKSSLSIFEIELSTQGYFKEIFHPPDFV